MTLRRFGLALALGFFFCATPLSAAPRVTVELNDGSRLRGELLKKNEEFIHLSVGDQVITLERAKVEALTTPEGQEETVRPVGEFDLYRTAERPVKDISTLTEELGSAVVTVRTPGTLGTGWFCDPEGYVVTNCHIISGERSVTVTAFVPEGGGFAKKVHRKVRIVALSGHMDLALLKVEEDLGIEVPQLFLGDSRRLEEGDPVFTIGNPLGLERSTSEGIISRVSRNIGGRLYLQTTADISPGNSGGPLFNESGEVVGVTSRGHILLGGLGFAIPSRYVKEFLDNIEAFAYDPANPNSGLRYMQAPLASTDGSVRFSASEFVKTGAGVSCLTAADVDGDGVEEAVFVNNHKGEIGVLKLREEKPVGRQPGDYEDLNLLPRNERFAVETHAVNNKIAALAVDDLNADGLPDLLFYGDIDGLAVLDQKEDGSFGPARRLADVEVAGRPDALRITDLDGDGHKEVFALGPDEVHVMEPGGEPRSFPLNASYRDSIIHYDFSDLNGDGRLDLVLFCGDRFYATHVVLQGPDGSFVCHEMVPSHLWGPVRRYAAGPDDSAYITLDKGRNRVRRLSFTRREGPTAEGRLDISPHALLVDVKPRAAGGVEIADLDGDGRRELVTVSKTGNEFLVFRPGRGGFSAHRSPSPRHPEDLELFTGQKGRAVVFALSRDDRLFGVSRLGPERIEFPRQINTEGTVEFIWQGRVDEEDVLLWVEKVGDSYLARTAPAAKVAEKAYEAGRGTIDVEARTLRFGSSPERLTPELPGKPAGLAFGDFNADGTADLVIYWLYSGRESLYLGLGEGRYRSVISDREFLEEEDDRSLVVADIDGDAAEEVLLVRPGFVRVLRVDRRNKLYVDRQFNWEHGQIRDLVPYGEGEPPRFLAISGHTARVVRFDLEAGGFKLLARADLAGITPGVPQVADVNGDGGPDILIVGGNAVQVLYTGEAGRALESEIVLDAKLETLGYWNVHTADLTGDGRDEVLLFDSRKSMLEIYRSGPDGRLDRTLRHRLFERTIHARGEEKALELPRQFATGDLDGNGRLDFLFFLKDRLAVYLQGPED